MQISSEGRRFRVLGAVSRTSGSEGAWHPVAVPRFHCRKREGRQIGVSYQSAVHYTIAGRACEKGFPEILCQQISLSFILPCIFPIPLSVSLPSINSRHRVKTFGDPFWISEGEELPRNRSLARSHLPSVATGDVCLICPFPPRPPEPSSRAALPLLPARR